MRLGPARLLSLLLLQLPGSTALPLVEPFVTYLDRTGHFQLGLLDLPVDDPLPPAGLGPVSHATYDFSTQDCHRLLRFRLEYVPQNLTVGAGPVQVSVPYQFRLRLYDAASGDPLPNGTFDWTEPGDKLLALDGPRAVRAELFLRIGRDVDYALRVTGASDPGAECAWQGLLFVNEAEANPPGTDAGNEWVELFHRGFVDADLSGWTLRALHGSPESMTFPAGTVLSPGSRLVVFFPAQFLDNVDEQVVLEAPRGWAVDRTPPLTDDQNDGRSWQRIPDGDEAWSFLPSSAGSPNA